MIVTVVSDQKALEFGTDHVVVNFEGFTAEVARAKMETIIAAWAGLGWVIVDQRNPLPAPEIEESSKEASYWWEK
jgi:hypothetical protein